MVAAAVVVVNDTPPTPPGKRPAIICDVVLPVIRDVFWSLCHDSCLEFGSRHSGDCALKLVSFHRIFNGLVLLDFDHLFMHARNRLRKISDLYSTRGGWCEVASEC